MRGYWEYLASNVALSMSDDDAAVLAGGRSMYWAVKDSLVPLFAAYLVLFLGVGILAPRVLRRVPGFLSWDAEAQKDAGMYVSAALHHLYVVPASVALIALDYAGYSVNPRYAALFAPWSAAYLVSDAFFSAIPDALRGKGASMLLHHICGLGLCGAALAASAPLTRWYPHILLMEASTLPFEAMWALRKAGQEGGRAYAACSFAFVLFFLLSRIVNFPLALLAVFTVHAEDAATLGPFAWALPPLAVLQFYWFAKILMMVCGKKKKADRGSEAAGAVASASSEGASEGTPDATPAPAQSAQEAGLDGVRQRRR